MLRLLWLAAVFAVTEASRPNVVLLIADDLGIGDLGCYGNLSVPTPYIDSLARSGAQFSHALAAAPVCTPSRAAMLTGRYPVRSGMASSHPNFPVIIWVAQMGGLPDSEPTIAREAQQRGYSTALIGKWHLGLHCGPFRSDFCHHPIRHGFDYFYGLPWTNVADFAGEPTVVFRRMPWLINTLRGIFVAAFITTIALFHFKRSALALCALLSGIAIPAFVYFMATNLHLLNGVIMRNLDVVEQPLRLNGIVHRFLEESSNFVQNSSKPFFLVLSFTHVHTALLPADEFIRRSNHGLYGAMVSEMDWAVGQIMNMLKQTGKDENTIVMFTSDQGGVLEDVGPDGMRRGGHNGPFKGGKGMGGLDGAIRVPLLVSWPKKIKTNSRIDFPVSLMDIYPTLLHIWDQNSQSSPSLDGHSFLPLLLNTSSSASRRLFIHYCGEHVHAARLAINASTIWKVRFATPVWKPNTTVCSFLCPCDGPGVQWHDPPLLFDIVRDVAEDRSILSTDRVYKTVVPDIVQAVKNHTGTMPVEVPNQLHGLNGAWIPWLQPCCNPPYCRCMEHRFDQYTQS